SRGVSRPLIPPPGTSHCPFHLSNTNKYFPPHFIITSEWVKGLYFSLPRILASSSLTRSRNISPFLFFTILISIPSGFIFCVYMLHQTVWPVFFHNLD